MGVAYDRCTNSQLCNDAPYLLWKMLEGVKYKDGVIFLGGDAQKGLVSCQDPAQPAPLDVLQPGRDVRLHTLNLDPVAGQLGQDSIHRGDTVTDRI